MNAEKIGNFIRELRKEKKWTQEDLAKRIPLGREAISKWERGVSYPDHSSLIRLSEIFNVTINELLYGERKNETNAKEVVDVALAIYKDRNRKNKYFMIAIICLLLLLISFFLYYFINTFNTIKVYNIGYINDNINISNGIMVITKEKIHFNLGDIHSNERIINLRLYYQDKKKEEHLIVSTNSLKIVLVDFLGNNSYFDFNNINDIINNMYLEIKYEDRAENIKLDISKSFSNDYIIPEELSENGSNFETDYNIERTEEKIKQIFKEENGIYNYINKKEEFSYIPDAKILNLISNNDNNIQEWNYNLITNYLSYNEYKNNQLINSFSYNSQEIICNINQCSNEKETIDIFFKETAFILE